MTVAKNFLIHIVALLLALVLTLSCAVACKDNSEQNSTQPKQLETPKNIVAENWVLTWDAVENAVGYTILFENTEYNVDNCIFDMSFYDISGTYNVEVMARGDGTDYYDSDFIASTIVLEDKIFDEFGFQYALLTDGTGYSVRKGKADLTGDIVIPDYFCGLPVKKIRKKRNRVGA